MKNQKVTIKPLSDRVLVKEILSKDTETKTKSGIILLAGNEDKGTKHGEVIGIGKKVEADVKIGDTVIFSWGDKITIEGTEYFIVKETELIATINV
jgi:co-chaperonin GroES (HSP10)